MNTSNLSTVLTPANSDQFSESSGTSNAHTPDSSLSRRRQQEWLTAVQMRQKFRVLGFDDDIKGLHIDRIQCWAISGSDRTGRAVEVFFHPVSGEVIELITRED
jgi:hypothetical protein